MRKRLTIFGLIILGIVGVCLAVTNVYIVEPTTVSDWTVYDGNTDDANYTAAGLGLWEGVADANCDANATVISVKGNSILELTCAAGTVDGNQTTLTVDEYSASTPTMATHVRATQYSLGTSVLYRKMNAGAFGIADANTDCSLWAPIRQAVTPGGYVTLTVVEDLDGNSTGPVYVKYRLTTGYVVAE